MADRFPDNLVQECRNLLSVEARDICMTEKANGENLEGQHLYQEKVFHGSHGYASVMDKMLEGKGEYAEMFHRKPIENNREGNEKRKGGYMLELKSIFSCDDASNYVVFERGFTRENLGQNKDGTRLARRNINDRGLTVIANFKMALKFTNEFLNNNGTYPSGKDHNDLVQHVREQMFVYLKGAKNKKSNSRRPSNEEREFTAASMPPKYMFNGFFAFVLFGPDGLAGTTKSCLSVDGKNVAKEGRAAARAKAAKAKDAERSANVGSTGVHNRGVAMKEQIQLAHLAHSELKEQMKNVRDLLFHNSSAEANALKGLEQINLMIDRAEARNEERELRHLQKRKNDLFDELDGLAKRKRELEKKSDYLMSKQYRKDKSVDSFLPVANIECDTLDEENDNRSSLTEKTPAKSTTDTTSSMLPDYCTQPSQQSQDEQSPEVLTITDSSQDSPLAVLPPLEHDVLPPLEGHVTEFTGPAANLSDRSKATLMEFRRKAAAAARKDDGGHNKRPTSGTWNEEEALNDRIEQIRAYNNLNHSNAHDYYGANDRHI